MKIEIPRDQLLSALGKMHDVATKALVPDYDHSGLITVDVRDKKVIFASSNGYLSARCEIDVPSESTGIVTTDATKLHNVVQKIFTKGQSDPISLEEKDGLILIKDASSKRKKIAKLPKNTYDHDHRKVVAKLTGNTMVFESDHFSKGVKKVAPFQSKGGYKQEYQSVLFHCTKDETRIVCGDGSIFAIFSSPKHLKSTNKECKHLVPVDQLLVINSVVGDSTEISMTWKDSSLFLKSDDGVELCLRGLPDISYVAYDVHAFRSHEAKAIVDVKVSDVHEAAGFVGVLEDQEKIDLHQVLSCVMSASSSKSDIEFKVTEKQSKFQCECEAPASYYNINNQPEFNCVYAHLFLDGPAKAAVNEYLRFFLLDESNIMIVKDVNLAEKDDNGVPRIKESVDGCSLSFFFSSIDETDD